MQEDDSNLDRMPTPFLAPTMDKDQEAPCQAALATPFVGRKKPWHVIQVQDTETLRFISRAVPSLKNEHNLQSLLVICGDLLACPQYGALISGCYDAAMNAMRTAWIHLYRPSFVRVYPDPDCVERAREALGLPDGMHPFGIVALHRKREAPAPNP